MIAFHHRVRPYRGEHARVVEPLPRGLDRVHHGVVRGGALRDMRRAADAGLR
jgi:hypothetical protein